MFLAAALRQWSRKKYSIMNNNDDALLGEIPLTRELEEILWTLLLEDPMGALTDEEWLIATSLHTWPTEINISVDQIAVHADEKDMAYQALVGGR